jgi:hypothetical protein
MWGIIDIKTCLIVMTLSTALTAMAHKTTQMKTFIETLMITTSNMNEANMMANMMTSWMTSRMNIKNQTMNKMNTTNSIQEKIYTQVMMEIMMMMT